MDEIVISHVNGATTKVRVYRVSDELDQDDAVVVEVDTDGEHPTDVRLWVNDVKVFSELVSP